ncbi:MAG: hypothetical protein LQ338_003633 [Usnochroma carphineum]|nr:MAG: hypothetical protein LQ338_003633 [Usnochroma carphineum]
MLPPTNPNLDLQTRFLLALLSSQAQHLVSAPSSPPPPYTNPGYSFPSHDDMFKPSVNQDPNFEEETTPRPAPLKIHIDATTTITGNSNRIMLPSPSCTQEHLTRLISVAVKELLPPTPSASGLVDEDEEEGGKEEQMIEVTLDAGTRIEGSGNVVVYRKEGVTKGMVGSGDGEGGKKRRASSEPVDMQRVKEVKRVKR